MKHLTTISSIHSTPNKAQSMGTPQLIMLVAGTVLTALGGVLISLSSVPGLGSKSSS